MGHQNLGLVGGERLINGLLSHVLLPVDNEEYVFQGQRQTKLPLVSQRP